jgi:hypothetical protein
VIETSSNDGTGRARSCKVSQVYALLKPGEQVPVRAEPTPEGVVVGALATEDMNKDIVPSTVTLTGSKMGWARIALNSKDYIAFDGKPHAFGWVPADALAVDTRLDGAVNIYSRPGLLGRVTRRIENEDQKFRVLGCRDDLLQVINAKEGDVWIDRWCARGEGCRR